jgi:predicted acetyltransferase
MALPITGAAPGSMRMLRHDEVLDVIRPLYDRIATRPGAITRPDWLWTRYFEKAIELGGDAEFVAVHSDPDGIDDGYVHYSVKWREERGGLPQGEGEYYDLFGADDAVELALVDYLCNVDLVREWYAEERPIDDPAQLGVADWRAYQVKGRWDEQWLRLLDVDVALAARTYDDVGGAVTIAVTDPLLATNNGVWQVSASGAERTGIAVDDAALTVDVRDLAAVYLGGTRWSQLAAVGRVGVRAPDAVAIADHLFVSPRAPFCCSGF